MVFQSYALFPNMTVADNVGFGLKVAEAAGRDPQARSRRCSPHQAADKGDRYPYQLSGGQQQRVALARALAIEPQGPAARRAAVGARRQDPRLAPRGDPSIQRQLGITTVYVTHDQEEALSMSDRIVVMSEGRIEQIGTPSEIYNSPATPFVASFVGTIGRGEGGGGTGT